ncbi:hypothetical protein ACFVX3_18340 [Rhodococcus erythropolis]
MCSAQMMLGSLRPPLRWPETSHALRRLRLEREGEGEGDDDDDDDEE